MPIFICDIEVLVETVLFHNYNIQYNLYILKNE